LNLFHYGKMDMLLLHVKLCSYAEFDLVNGNVNIVVMQRNHKSIYCGPCKKFAPCYCCLFFKSYFDALVLDEPSIVNVPGIYDGVCIVIT
jgi:hypothetical protein